MLLAHDLKVKNRLLRAYAQSDDTRVDLLTTLTNYRQGERFPRRYYDEAAIAEAVLLRDFSEYDVDAKQVMLEGRFVGQIGDTPVGYYRFRFRSPGERQHIAVVAGFPIDSHERGLSTIRWVNYTYESIPLSERDARTTQLLEAMEDW